MTKKKKEKKQRAPEPVTDEQIHGIALTMSQKISAMLKDFIHKTGRVVAEIRVGNDISPMVDGRASITQTVSIDYGIPEIRPAIPNIGGGQ